MVNRVRKANRIAGTIAAAAAVAIVSLWTVSALTAGTASAAPPNPHLSAGTTTDSCAACHRFHTAQNDNLVNSTAPQSTLCFSCHDGTGADSNVAAEYSDPGVPADDPGTSSFYSHPATAASSHTSGLVDEFAGVLNRHAQCGDCHNPHTVSASVPDQTAEGWTSSGSLAGSSGVAAGAPLSWKGSIGFEYELCLKCHSIYTTLLTYSAESEKKTDKAAEFDPANASYHPVRAPGKNNTAALDNSLLGGSLWHFTTGSTIRCTHCHGNYRLPGSPLVVDTPPPSARLAPHSSVNRGLLIANYQDRELKAPSAVNNYSGGDFALCYLCHSEAPFPDTSGDARSDTNFRFHGYHASMLFDDPAGNTVTSTDIDAPGAGQGNAICAECHFQTHSTRFAVNGSNQAYEGLVNFGPNVLPDPGSGQGPLWYYTPGSRGSGGCTLLCHGKQHENKVY